MNVNRPPHPTPTHSSQKTLFLRARFSVRQHKLAHTISSHPPRKTLSMCICIYIYIVCMCICVRTYYMCIKIHTVYIYIYWDISAVIPQHFDSASLPQAKKLRATRKAVVAGGASTSSGCSAGGLGSFWKFLKFSVIELRTPSGSLCCCAVTTTWTRKRKISIPPDPTHTPQAVCSRLGFECQ